MSVLLSRNYRPESVHRLTEVERLVDLILQQGHREDVVALLALLVGRCALALERSRELLQASTVPQGVLTVSQAVERYPVSRSWLYERGEGLGVARRLAGTRKLVVDEAALVRLLKNDRG